MVFNSRLMQPLFTRLANLLQNVPGATEHMRLQSQSHEFQNNRYRVFARFSLLFQSADDKHYDSTLRVPNPRITGGNKHNVKNRTHCLYASIAPAFWLT
jgi:hypothetical protein